MAVVDTIITKRLNLLVKKLYQQVFLWYHNSIILSPSLLTYSVGYGYQADRVYRETDMPPVAERRASTPVIFNQVLLLYATPGFYFFNPQLSNLLFKKPLDGGAIFLPTNQCHIGIDYTAS